MISSPLDAVLARRNIHYGWVVVGVPALGIALTLIFLWKRQLSAGAWVM
jgi:hypothetical protein